MKFALILNITVAFAISQLVAGRNVEWGKKEEGNELLFDRNVVKNGLKDELVEQYVGYQSENIITYLSAIDYSRQEMGDVLLFEGNLAAGYFRIKLWAIGPMNFTVQAWGIIPKYD